jgi:cytochrome c55X
MSRLPTSVPTAMPACAPLVGRASGLPAARRAGLPAVLLPLLLLLPGAALPPAAQASEPARRDTLVRMVRQDCGSCHGMRLTGGLGPAITREALADWPLDSLVATIYQGRPGTPMPGWRSMISEAEARWIAEQLRRGFPEEGSQ